MRKRNQTSLFPDQNMMSLEDYKKNRTKPKQHEKKFMQDIMQIAKSLGLPCLHIEYFCGNKFYARCDECSRKRKKVVEAKCPCCGKRVLAHCVNRINKILTHEYDIVGVGWGIETKHKINKGPQMARGTIGQQIRGLEYDMEGIPHLTINEDDAQLALEFLNTLRKAKRAK